MSHQTPETSIGNAWRQHLPWGMVAVLLFTSCLCRGAEPRGAVEQFTILATVKTVVPLQEFAGKAISVHPDPRFALTVRVESATPVLTGFATGSIVTFAIHSPAKLFGENQPHKQTLSFLLSRETRSGKMRFFALGLQSAATASVGDK